MVWMMRNTVIFFILIFTAAPAAAFAQDPLETLRQGIERGISVLEDPRFEDASRKPEQQQLLRELMQQYFDFREFSRNVLGRYWKKFSPPQKDEFVRVFSEFLGKLYLGRLQDRYNRERVNYLDQQLVGRSRALVKVEVLWRSVKVPVELRMTKRSGQWRVYDLSILGIDAVSNYRAQFKSILGHETPQQIIGRIKDKIADLDAKS
jgi:phospholipid transport system substrate-binding protein